MIDGKSFTLFDQSASLPSSVQSLGSDSVKDNATETASQESAVSSKDRPGSKVPTFDVAKILAQVIPAALQQARLDWQKLLMMMLLLCTKLQMTWWVLMILMMGVTVRVLRPENQKFI